MEKHIDFVKRIIQTNLFYKQVYGESIDRFADKIEFEQLPLITKKQIQEHYCQNHAFEGDEKNAFFFNTSGTTGMPMKIFWKKDEYIQSNFYTWKLRLRWYGITPQMRYCTFHSCATVGENIEKVDALIINQGRTLSLGRYIYTEERLINYIDMIKAFETQWILAPASVLCVLSKYMTDNNIKLDEIIYIEFNGEYVESSAFDIVQLAFPNAKIANLYGSTEFNGIALTCPHGNMHILNNNVYVETIEKKGLPEIYITGLVNTIMPFIRYQIGDVGDIEEGMCACGCSGPFLRLRKGRINELLKLKNNLFFDPASLNSVIFEINKREFIISQFQIIVHSVIDLEIVLLLSSSCCKYSILVNDIITACKKLNSNINYKVRFVTKEIDMYDGNKKYSFIRWKND